LLAAGVLIAVGAAIDLRVQSITPTNPTADEHDELVHLVRDTIGGDRYFLSSKARSLFAQQDHEQYKGYQEDDDGSRRVPVHAEGAAYLSTAPPRGGKDEENDPYSHDSRDPVERVPMKHAATVRCHGPHGRNSFGQFASVRSGL
jgi:hypothetical protein